MKNYAISQEELTSLRKNYLSDKTNDVKRHALSKTDINDLVYVSEQTDHTKDYFNVEVKTMNVCNQKQSGRCWIFASLNLLREHIAKQLNLEQFELSQNYMSFYDKLEKCNYVMNVLIDLKDKEIGDRELDFILNTPVGDGGQWDMFVSLVRKYGVMPKENFFETAQSNKTLISDKLINATLRQFACETHKKSEKECLKLRETYLAKFYTMLCNLFGVPPQKFVFTYKPKDGEVVVSENAITPVEFAKQYGVMDLVDEYQSVVNAPTKDKPFNKTYTVKYLGNVINGKTVTHLNVEMDRLKQLIIKSLKEGELVWFGSDVSHYGERTEGIWDDKLFDYKSLLGVDFAMHKDDALNFRESVMNHAMVITGVMLDEAEKPIRWKIENSWGDDKGRKGFYVMSDSFFDLYVYQAVIKKIYLNQTEADSLLKKPVELLPWDPLGTLAK